MSGTVQTRTPPGRSTRAHSASTAPGSGTYSRTLALTTASRLPSANGSARQQGSSCTQRTARPSSASAAWRSITDAMSAPVTRYPLAARCLASSPLPQPRSSSSPPGGASSPTARSSWSRRPASRPPAAYLAGQQAALASNSARTRSVWTVSAWPGAARLAWAASAGGGACSSTGCSRTGGPPLGDAAARGGPDRGSHRRDHLLGRQFLLTRDRLPEGSGHGQVPLVLTALPPGLSVHRDDAEVVDHHPAVTRVHLDPLLARRREPAAVADARERPVREAERDHRIVRGPAWAAAGQRGHVLDRRADKRLRGIDEMTHLTHRPAALAGIVVPVPVGDRASRDPEGHQLGRGHAVEHATRRGHGRRPPPVEASGEHAP